MGDFVVPNQENNGKLMACYDCREIYNVLFPVKLFTVYPGSPENNRYVEKLFCGKCFLKMATNSVYNKIEED